MSPLFKKLNLGQHRIIHVLDAPASFEAELKDLGAIKVKRAISAPLQFALAFVITRKELDSISKKLVEAAKGDAVIWIVYPKGTSKKYHCEFNRDSGWSVLGTGGYEPVRMVAVDGDWSALRFRRAEHIQVIKRKAASTISVTGKRRAKGQ